MKICWPWRKRKQRILSLFDPPLGYDPDVRLLRLPRRGETPHPKNVAGPFYVANQECTACGAPHAVAPDLMGWDQMPSTLTPNAFYPHCYFKKQPDTEAELEQAIAAIRVSCCGAFRYAGSDPAIIAKLKESGAADAL
jgi:hypothetical protein